MKYLRPTQNYTHYYTGSSTTKTAQPIQRATHKNVGHKNVGDERDDSVSMLERERESPLAVRTHIWYNDPTIIHIALLHRTCNCLLHILYNA